MNHDKESRLQLGLFGNDFAWHNWGSGQMLEGRDCILSGQADGFARQTDLPDSQTNTDGLARQTGLQRLPQDNRLKSRVKILHYMQAHCIDSFH